MTFSQALAFAGLILGLSMIPGPMTLLVTRNTLGRGLKAGLWTALGGSCGMIPCILVALLGILALIGDSPLYGVVQVGGMIYLMAMAAQCATRAVMPLPALTLQEAAGSNRPFVDGAMINLINPTLALFYLAIAPQYRDSMWPLPASYLLIGLIHMLVNFGWFTVLALFIGPLKPYLERSTVRRTFELVTCMVLLIFGYRMFAG